MSMLGKPKGGAMGGGFKRKRGRREQRGDSNCKILPFTR